MASTPADPAYWDEFYESGDGKNAVFEWYTSYEDIRKLLSEILHGGDKILHIGAGNSLLAEQILGDDLMPTKLSIANVDVSPIAVDRMNDHLDKLFQVNSSSSNFNSKKKSKFKKTEESNPQGAVYHGASRPWSRSQISYELEDVSKMKYGSNEFDVVLDKGMLDAVLSHGEEDTGENELVQKVLAEVFRVLKPNGTYFVISGMDQYLTTPYFVCDETIEWDFAPMPQSIQSRSPSLPTLRTVYCYTLKKKQ